jgi:hypothetical protein
MLLARLHRTSDRLSDDERNALVETIALADLDLICPRGYGS